MHDGHNAMTIACWPLASGAKNQCGERRKYCFSIFSFSCNVFKSLIFLAITTAHYDMINSLPKDKKFRIKLCLKCLQATKIIQLKKKEISHWTRKKYCGLKKKMLVIIIFILLPQCFQKHLPSGL